MRDKSTKKKVRDGLVHAEKEKGKERREQGADRDEGEEGEEESLPVILG